MTNKELVNAFFDAADRNDAITVKKLFGSNHMFHTKWIEMDGMNFMMQIGALPSMQNA